MRAEGTHLAMVFISYPHLVVLPEAQHQAGGAAQSAQHPRQRPRRPHVRQQPAGVKFIASETLKKAPWLGLSGRRPVSSRFPTVACNWQQTLATLLPK
jgi:hypothetical protein